MTEITLLADQLGKVGIMPADLVALGAACTAAAAAGILTKTALKQIELMRQEAAEETPESRQAKLIILKDTMSVLLEKLGPEAQANAIETIIPSVTELIGLA